MKILRFAAAAAFVLAAGAASAAETLVRVNTFPTARSLPFVAGQTKGIFAKHGLKVEVTFTENSQQQRDGLAAGRTDPLLWQSECLSGRLWGKGVGNALRVWDGFAHDWPAWAEMLRLYLGGHD